MGGRAPQEDAESIWREKGSKETAESIRKSEGMWLNLWFVWENGEIRGITWPSMFVKGAVDLH